MTADQQLENITNVILKAQKNNIPTKITHLRGPRWKASPQVRAILQKCKEIYRKWEELGKPQNHKLKIELKEQKL